MENIPVKWRVVFLAKTKTSKYGWRLEELVPLCDVFENRWQKLDILLTMLIDPSTKGILFLQESRITKSEMNINPDEDNIGRIFYRAISTNSMLKVSICSYWTSFINRRCVWQWLQWLCDVERVRVWLLRWHE